MPQPEPEATHASTDRPVRGNRCGEAADGVEGIEKAGTTKPDLVILDLAMPRMNGVEAAAVLSQTMPDLPIVLLTMYENFLGNSLALTGVTAVVSKTDGMDKLVACVNSLLRPPKTMAAPSA
jgi:DNA-binding NarL/FixJ family response regulator